MGKPQGDDAVGHKPPLEGAREPVRPGIPTVDSSATIFHDSSAPAPESTQTCQFTSLQEPDGSGSDTSTQTGEFHPAGPEPTDRRDRNKDTASARARDR